MAAAAYASVAAAGVGTGVASVSVNKPSGVASGDLLVTFCYANSAVATWTGPAGWTKIVDNSTNCSSATFTRVADGSEGASFTFTRAGTTVNNAGATCVRVTGAGTVAASGIGFDTSTTIALPSVVAASANTLLLQIVGRVVTGATWTPPGGTTERFDITASGTALNTAGGDQVVGAGATGTRTWTQTVAQNSRGTILAINPVPTPSGAVTGGYDFSGSVTGQQPDPTPSGAVTGGYDFSGTATGTSPVVPPVGPGNRWHSGSHLRFGLRAGLRSSR